MKLFTHNKKKPTHTYMTGICGIRQGCGVTYLCIMSACFLQLYARKKVAVIDMCGSGDYVSLGKDEKVSGAGFYKKGIYFVPYGSLRDVAGCINDNFDICIMDYGTVKGGMDEELLRCDLKVIEGPGALWLDERWDYFFEQNKAVRDWSSFRLCLSPGGISEDRKKTKRYREFLKIPYMPRIFEITDDMIAMLYDMFEAVLD